MAIAGDESLLRFPTPFPIKVMGAHVDGFVDAVVAVVRRIDPGFDRTTVSTRESRGGRWLAITVTITATSRAQLDELYRALCAHPMVRLVL